MVAHISLNADWGVMSNFAEHLSRTSVPGLFMAPQPNKVFFDNGVCAWERRRGVQKSAPPDLWTMITNIVGTRLLKTSDGTRLNPTAPDCTRVHWSTTESTRAHPSSTNSP